MDQLRANLAEMKREHDAQRRVLVEELRRLVHEAEANPARRLPAYVVAGYRRRLATYESGC